MAEFLLTFGICLLFAYWCFRIAKANGRDETLAAILGFLFGIIAVVGYYLIGKTLEQRQKEVLEIVRQNEEKQRSEQE